MMNKHAFPVAFYFEVAIGKDEHVSSAVFQEVSGITADSGVELTTQAGQNRFVHRVPQLVKHNNLVLKRGLLPVTSTLVQWCHQTLEAGFATQIQSKDMTVSLLDADGLLKAQWLFVDAYPLKWHVDALHAQDNKLVIETIEFAYATGTRTQ